MRILCYLAFAIFFAFVLVRLGENLSCRQIVDRIGLQRYSSWFICAICIIVWLGFGTGSISCVLGESLVFYPIYFLFSWWKKKLSLRGFLDGLIIYAVVGCLGFAYDTMRLRSIEETEILTVNEAQAYFRAHGRYPAETQAQHSSLWAASIYYSIVIPKDGSQALVYGIYLYPFGRTCYFLKNGTVSGPHDMG